MGRREKYEQMIIREIIGSTLKQRYQNNIRESKSIAG